MEGIYALLQTLAVTKKKYIYDNPPSIHRIADPPEFQERADFPKFENHALYPSTSCNNPTSSAIKVFLSHWLSDWEYLP